MGSMRRLGAYFLAAVLALPAGAQEIRSQMEITVERILLDLYVTDNGGEPIDDLRPSNFRVTIGGMTAEVDAVEFVDMTAPPPLPEEIHPDSDLARRPPGRLLVFFFQTDFGREPLRVAGHLKMIHYALRFLDDLQAEDRVAVVQFDSHFKIREDFTNDRARLTDAIRASLRTDIPPPPVKVPSPALMTRLDREEMKDAASPERALLLLGNALIPIPGPKSIVMFGWGLGRLTPGGIGMTPEYGPARRALEKARAAVFSIDVSPADYHSLEFGQKKIAEDTGGFYVKTNLFPEFAMERLKKTISGRYELFVKRPPDLPRGIHDVHVKVVGRGFLQVLVRDTWADPPV